MGELVLRVVCLAALVSGCTKHVNQCTSDSDCTNPAYPFCDVNGEFPASGGMKDVCTVTPANCPVDRCGCMPGAVLSCSADQATVCGADGKSSIPTACPLGCATDGTRCATFEPSNGLGGALGEAGSAADIALPSGAKIDTDTGAVTDMNGVPIDVPSVVVAQSGGPSIRAFLGHSIQLDDLTVTGAGAVAFVASGAVTIQGDVEVAASGAASGPGAGASTAACAGSDGLKTTCSVDTSLTQASGASGGGNATPGGAGGQGPAGGAAVSAVSPLIGGCEGGALRDSTSTVLDPGGGGGGAIEIVSAQQISLVQKGFINAAGGGGGSSGGGGAGGTVILEAPKVTISGMAAGITANGGAGGGCGKTGQDGLRTVVPATTSGCAGGNYGAGDGGTGSAAATSGTGCVMGTCFVCSLAGGGGGSVGRLRIATRDGAYTSDSSPVLSAAISTAALEPQ